MKLGLYRYRHPQGGCFVVYVIGKGRKWIRFVSLGTVPVAVRQAKLSEQRYFTPLEYDSETARAKILGVGSRLGMTVTAERALQ